MFTALFLMIRVCVWCDCYWSFVVEGCLLCALFLCVFRCWCVGVWMLSGLLEFACGYRYLYSGFVVFCCCSCVRLCLDLICLGLYWFWLVWLVRFVCVLSFGWMVFTLVVLIYYLTVAVVYLDWFCDLFVSAVVYLIMDVYCLWLTLYSYAYLLLGLCCWLVGVLLWFFFCLLCNIWLLHWLLLWVLHVLLFLIRLFWLCLFVSIVCGACFDYAFGGELLYLLFAAVFIMVRWFMLTMFCCSDRLVMFVVCYLLRDLFSFSLNYYVLM